MEKTNIAVLLVCGAFSLSACAGAPSQRAEPDPAVLPSKAQPEPSSSDRLVLSRCLKETGSRIKPAEDDCLSGPGRVIDGETLEQSGGLTLGDKLRRSGL